jgi:hypothetical protein
MPRTANWLAVTLLHAIVVSRLTALDTTRERILVFFCSAEPIHCGEACSVAQLHPLPAQCAQQGAGQ